MKKNTKKVYSYEKGCKITVFESQWGISANELAQQDGVTPEAIRMRVHLYGSPFQRRAKPTIYEVLYGKTQYVLAKEIGIHPQTVRNRMNAYNNPWRVSPQYDHNSGKQFGDKPWWEEPRWAYTEKEWLHPMHPDYGNWRVQYIAKLLGEKDESQ